jgi:hypothetical protein
MLIFLESVEEGEKVEIKILQAVIPGEVSASRFARLNTSIHSQFQNLL